jgi:hypothetical protein
VNGSTNNRTLDNSSVNISSSDSLLSGTWDDINANNHIKNLAEYFETTFSDDYIGKLVFSGESFTYTTYRIINEYIPPPPPTPDPNADPNAIVLVPVPPGVPMGLPSLLSYLYGEGNEESIENQTIIDSKGGIRDIEVIQITIKGKYSISDDKIEFVTSDNVVRVMTFTSTENTLTINDIVEFVRSGMNR